MRFRLTRGFSRRLPVGRIFLLAALLFFCFITGVGSVTAQTVDDHGNDFNNDATDLPLGSSITGRIDPGDDQDVFKLDLSGAPGITDVWIYTTGNLDTQGELYDSSRGLIARNDNSYIVWRETSFSIRSNLPGGIYYLEVQSRDGAIGDYTLHAEAVTDPGATRRTAAALHLGSPTPGMIDTAKDSDYFKFVLDESKNLVVYAVGSVQFDGNHRLLPLGPFDGDVIDNSGEKIDVNIYPIRYNRDKLLSPKSRHSFQIEDNFNSGAYYIKVTVPADDATYPVPYTIHAYEDTDYTGFIKGCKAKTAALNNPQISDPLYGCQWHLRNQEQGGEDINVEPVWAEDINGEGVNVAVVDDTMDYSHEDLAGNINSSLNHDYGGMGGAYRPFEHHGTAVAGIIAGRDNGAGVRGVAPRASVYGNNLLVGNAVNRDRLVQDVNIADAMSRNRVVTAVSNNSWGYPVGPRLDHAYQLWEFAIDSGIREGYDGKGVFYVFAGGNGGRGHPENPDGTLVGGHTNNVRDRGDDSNLSELANHYAVTAVCAVNDGDVRSVYSEKGANLWVCAPSKDGGEQEYRVHRGIVTTENSDRYRSNFAGTSAAAPIVSGVAALLRHANPGLTWRDLKLILAASARKNDAANPGWAEGARKYGADSDTDLYHFNHEYGFGVVDAKAAVDLAQGWTNVPTLESVSAESEAEVTIPPPSGGVPQTVTTTLMLDTGMRFTEFVEINTNFDHKSFRDMEIELVSPSGAVSKLAVPFNTRHYHYYTDDTCTYGTAVLGEIRCVYFVSLDEEFRFGSSRHLGENPNGVWTLRLTDHYPEMDGTLRWWSIKVYGHMDRPGAPTITTPITAGDGSLTVAWSAPSDNGGTAITAYDLRHVQASAGGTADAKWTLVEDVWTTGSGPLAYIITGLAGAVQYDVEVRAVSAAGKGAWSIAAAGTPARPVSPCITGVAVPGAASNPGLVADCEALLAVGNTLAGSGTLNWSGSVAMGSWDGVTVDGSPLRVASLALSDSHLTGTILPELGNLTNLERLNLTRNQLTGPIPSELSLPTNLQLLALGGNQLTGPIPASLGSLANLQGLYLYGNQLSGEMPAELGSLANLEELFLGGNQLTGCIPVGVAGVANNDLSHLGLPFCAGASGAPTIGTLTAGADFLTITWAAPTGSTESAIIAYDLRHIESAAQGNSDANWTVVDDAWTAASGALSYQIADLTGGTRYDVQIRAVTATGDGPWSAAAAGTPATWGAIRSFSPPSVAPAGEVVVTITASGYGGFGGVTETLPPGFSHVSSNLEDTSVTVNGREVRFSLFGKTAFTHTATAPGTEGTYSFSGVLRNSDREDVPVGGALTIAVAALDPLIVRYDADGNGMIEKSEIIEAINNYLFGEGDEAVSKAEIIRIINLYLFG